jgi:hypothetical protein
VCGAGWLSDNLTDSISGTAKLYQIFDPSNEGKTITDRAGAPDRRVEMTDVTGERIPTKLRFQITDPHIRGPIKTGWGAADFPKQVAQRILLTTPAS